VTRRKAGTLGGPSAALQSRNSDQFKWLARSGILKSVNPRDDQRGSESRTRAKSQVLALAKQLLTGQISAVAASRKLSPLRHGLESELAEVLLVFAAIDSETDTLPIGEVRQRWSREALERKDREITEAEDYYHDRAMEAAYRLVQILEGPS
jgi:hypothetical protein